jgi:hypothetical protein
MCAAVTGIFRVCKSMRLLYLLVVTIWKCSINLVTNPNPVYSYSYAWQYKGKTSYIISKETCITDAWRISRRVFSSSWCFLCYVTWSIGYTKRFPGGALFLTACWITHDTIFTSCSFPIYVFSKLDSCISWYCICYFSSQSYAEM